MFAEFLKRLSVWEGLDTWIAITGAMASMACALPGAWLLLRRQSMLGDALSHAVLPGIVIAYLGVTWLEDSGHLSGNHLVPAKSVDQSHSGRVAEGMSIIVRRQIVLFAGAGISGVVAALLSEIIQRRGGVERSAALGVVFTSMFALGLLLIRLLGDKAHLHAGCVLYGNLETNAKLFLAGTRIPQAVVINEGMLLINGILVIVFYKELQLSTFDPGLAESFNLQANWVSLALMTVTAATVVTAFESVGAILVIAMLIVPAATARLLTDRLARMLWISLAVAATGAGLGHVFALTIPAMICSRLGFRQVNDVGTAGMMSVTTGGLFLLAVVASPRQGILRAFIERLRLQIRIASEDLLGALYRRAETAKSHGLPDTGQTPGTSVLSRFMEWVARKDLIRSGMIVVSTTGDVLTEKGESLARSLVRSHRLWEAYMARHFELPYDHLHATAEQVEHYLGPDLQAELAAELHQPTTDPHGKSIPPEQ